MRLLRRICLGIAIAGFCMACAGRTAVAQQATDPTGAGKPPRATQLQDAPEILIPRSPRTDAENDRIEALAMFAAARMKEHQGDGAEALRLYQRALRHDPNSLAILRQIVPLALKLNRIDEFLRYALKIAERDPSNSALLRQLAEHLAGQGRFSQAIMLYEQELSQRDGEKKTGARVVLWNQLGRLYFLDGRLDKAAESFAKVVEALDEPGEYSLRDAQRKAILGESDRTYQLFGATFLQTGDLDRAAAAFENAERISPNEAVHAFRMAQIAHRRGKLDEALTHLDVYFNAHQSTEGSLPYALLEELLKSLDRAGELQTRLTDLYQSDTHNRPLAEYLADLHRQAEQWDQAEPIYAGLLEHIESDLFDQEPSIADFRGQEGAAYRARAAGALRGLAEIYRRTRAVRQLYSLLARAAAAGSGLEILGDEAQLLAKNETLLSALVEHAHKQRAAAADHFSYGPALAIATLALQSGRVEEAGEFFDAAVRAEEDLADETLLTWGLGLLIIDRYKEAAAVFQRGVDGGGMPDDPRYHYFLAGALEMSGQTDQALAAAREAANLGSSDPRIVSRVGWVLYHAKRYAEALEAYTELVEHFDTERRSSEIRDSLRNARLVLSNICVLQGDLQRAEEWLQQVLDEFPEDISALNDLGYLWADQNKHLERALAMVQKAVDGDPENAAYRDSLGWAFYRLGRFDEAVVALEKAAAIDDPDGVILDHLGDAYQASGATDKALKAWKQALEALQSSDETDRIEQLRRKTDPE